MDEKRDVYEAVPEILKASADCMSQIAFLIETGKLEQLEQQRRIELTQAMYNLSAILLDVKKNFETMRSEELKGRDGKS